MPKWNNKNAEPLEVGDRVTVRNFNRNGDKRQLVWRISDIREVRRGPEKRLQVLIFGRWYRREHVSYWPDQYEIEERAKEARKINWICEQRRRPKVAWINQTSGEAVYWYDIINLSKLISQKIQFKPDFVQVGEDRFAPDRSADCSPEWDEEPGDYEEPEEEWFE